MSEVGGVPRSIEAGPVPAVDGVVRTALAAQGQGERWLFLVRRAILLDDGRTRARVEGARLRAFKISATPATSYYAQNELAVEAQFKKNFPAELAKIRRARLPDLRGPPKASRYEGCGAGEG